MLKKQESSMPTGGYDWTPMLCFLLSLRFPAPEFPVAEKRGPILNAVRATDEGDLLLRHSLTCKKNRVLFLT